MPKSIEKNCKACGQKITVRLADHKRGWGNFCDKSCAAAFKTGQRPRDVNAGHAKHSHWAAQTMAVREAHPVEQAAPIKEQLGYKPKVKPKHHSPGECIDCGASVNGERRCFTCQTHVEATAAMEEGWDGHKAVS